MSWKYGEISAVFVSSLANHKPGRIAIVNWDRKTITYPTEHSTHEMSDRDVKAMLSSEGFNFVQFSICVMSQWFRSSFNGHSSIQHDIHGEKNMAWLFGDRQHQRIRLPRYCRSLRTEWNNVHELHS